MQPRVQDTSQQFGPKSHCSMRMEVEESMLQSADYLAPSGEDASAVRSRAHVTPAPFLRPPVLAADAAGSGRFCRVVLASTLVAPAAGRPPLLPAAAHTVAPTRLNPTFTAAECAAGTEAAEPRPSCTPVLNIHASKEKNENLAQQMLQALPQAPASLLHGLLHAPDAGASRAAASAPPLPSSAGDSRLAGDSSAAASQARASTGVVTPPLTKEASAVAKSGRGGACPLAASAGCAAWCTQLAASYRAATHAGPCHAR